MGKRTPERYLSDVVSPAHKLTFRKPERLCSRAEIERLFGHGTSIQARPLKLIFVLRDALPEIAAKTMFVVPKRNFRRAHDRNLLKRRMREAFRIRKSELYEDLRSKKKQVSMALLYTGREENDYATIEKAIGSLLKKLRETI